MSLVTAPLCELRQLYVHHRSVQVWPVLNGITQSYNTIQYKTIVNAPYVTSESEARDDVDYRYI